MKVLFLTRRFYPDIGGVEKHVLEISRLLVARGHEVIVISENSPDIHHSKYPNYQSIGQSDTQGITIKKPVKSIQSDTFELNGIEVIRINVGREGLIKKFRIWVQLFGKINKIHDADVVHCHDVFFWYLPFRFLFPRKKIFTTFHGYESYPPKIKAIIVRKISETLSNGNICVGEFMKKWYYAKPNYIIYGGVRIPKKFKEIRSPLGIFFGRLDNQTGIDQYRRAEQLIKKNLPNFKLIVFEHNPKVEKELTNYRFAFVSRYLSILEAMAAKKIVFAVFDNPLKKDYLEMTPFKNLINISGSARELASQVQFYYSNKNIEQNKVNGAFSWVKDQTWDKVVDVYILLWKKH